MLPFIRKRKSAEADKRPAGRDDPAEDPPAAVPPGVQLLKEVWHIDTRKKKKEMPPPEVPHDIYCVPSKRHVPRRHGGSD
jgi:hypothetical protein